MNIIIPIGGIGKRFSDEGFTRPKPLINVLGKPMIFRVISSLSVSKEDLVTIVYSPELNRYNFRSQLKKEFPKVSFNFVELEGQTKGASETILFGLQKMDQKSLSEEFLVVDCDTFYEDDILEKYRKSKFKNNIFYFTDNEDLPIFSYIKTDDSGKVIEIKEKIKISNNANTGAYGFCSGKVLKKYCEDLVSSPSGEELYVSSLYQKMILSGESIYSTHVEKFHCVGTPLQLRIYSENNIPQEQIKFCFDLDNTLVSYPEKEGDYSTVSPLQKNIDFLNFLKSNGNYIIIYTARRMKTHEGNVGKIIKDISRITLETLDKFGIEYDELHFGKPHADFYIDDLGVSCFDSLDKITGFFQTQNLPRSFNSVSYSSDRVKKISNNPGESFWYQNIPRQIEDLFPIIYKAGKDCIEMEKIRGINFSYLYTNGALREENIHELMGQIKRVHSCSFASTVDRDLIYRNYLLKIKNRYEIFFNIYEEIEGSKKIYEALCSYFSSYEKNLSGMTKIIHGDPVFTNVFLTERGIKFIDPRGKLGETLSLLGDVYYDYAKIYQSILGYDYILNDLEINYEYQERMIKAFESYFDEMEMEKIKWVCASLFFTLIPLHQFSKTRFNKYTILINKLIPWK